MTGRRIVLIGEFVVDVTLPTHTAATKVRLGGIFHAARAAWAVGVAYEIAYFAPDYLDAEVEKQAGAHGAARTTKLGSISGSPNVMLIGEATEAGPQLYEHLLSDHLSFSFDGGQLAAICTNAEVVILSGNFPLTAILSALTRTNARVHIDIGNGPQNLPDPTTLGRPLKSLFLSTSARVFPSLASGLPGRVAELVGPLTDKVILKENRGGARLFGNGGNVAVGAQRRTIVHSVGVGDAFDVVYVALAEESGDHAALSYASWIAAEYAATTFPDDFQRETKRVLQIPAGEICALPGVSLPWEARPGCQIYIAGPDFDYVDRRPIEVLIESLKYHNFSPRLPVRENGQANEEMSHGEKRALYQADMALLESCGLLIAVNIFDDPGTLIEIGLASAMGIPVLVYDPKEKAENVMLLHVPKLVSSSLDQIITATFDLVARQCRA